METLEIRMFGVVDLHSGGRPVRPPPTQKAKALLCFLLLHRNRRYAREVLSDLFWPSRPGAEARRCLRTELWRVTSALEESRSVPRGTHLVAEGSEIGFDGGSDYWLDVAEFERRLDAVGEGGDAVLSDGGLRSLTEAIALYRGDLLETVDYEWCLFERQRLRARVLAALERVLHHHQARGEWDLAVDTAYQLLDLDPLLEHVHRELMRCFHRMGNRGAALRQFDVCAGLLADELDVEPMVETIALCRQIRRGEGGELVDLPKVGPSRRSLLQPAVAEGGLEARVLAALSEVDAAAGRLEDARGRLLGALAELERRPPPS